MTKHSQLPLSDVKCSYINNFLTGSSVLDVGAGKGYYSHWLGKAYPAITIQAIDWQQPPLMPTNVQFLKHNLEEPIPLNEESFNTIFAFDIIEHITNEKSFINELFRLCTNHGVIIGSVPHDNDLFLPAYNLTFYHRSDLTHKRYYTPESIKSALAAAGFVNIHVSKEGGVSPQVFAEFFPPPLRWSIKKVIGLLRRTHIINTKKLNSDLFFVAHKIIT
ncbi:class I SAM-dependent methyltransferase [Candidatus Dependentiae bacterium]|nr:class I SAM-dependent methyltransferase [Candidatus Dependentiae bacterium]